MSKKLSQQLSKKLSTSCEKVVKKLLEPPSGMIMRWFNTLSNINFLIEHRPGKKHANADALSRCAHAEEPDPDDEQDEIIAMMH
jgi:hypothetical protein